MNRERFSASGDWRVKEFRVLFLGAGRRVSLFERMACAARAEGFEPVLFAYEDSPHVPVSQLATVIPGLPWQSADFADHLHRVIRANDIALVVPCMDGATVALSTAADAVDEAGAWAAVSGRECCATFEDKRSAQSWFIAHGVRTPIRDADTPPPWIVKPARGFAGRGQHIVYSDAELTALGRRVDLSTHVLQPLVEGPEYTIDAYVSRSRRVLGCVTRRRLQVAAGEVVSSRTERRDALIGEATRILHCAAFVGPITLQAIAADEADWFIEVNPRFGGGVILSIEAGADYARLLVRETLGRPVDSVQWREGVMMTRAYRETFHEAVACSS